MFSTLHFNLNVIQMNFLNLQELSRAIRLPSVAYTHLFLKPLLL